MPPSRPPAHARPRGSSGNRRSAPSRGGSRAPSHRGSASKFRRRRIIAGALAVFVIIVVWLAISLGTALTDPSLGTSPMSRFAEWGRSNHIGFAVTWLEKEYYSINTPATGGKPPPNAFKPGGKTTTTVATSSCPHALPVPAAVASPVQPPQPGEGQWQPAARESAGCPAIYETFVRPDTIHTSYVIGIAWMDPKLLSATLYSGSQVPGGGPYSHTAPVSPSAATTLVSAFNAGFRSEDSQGGYFTDGKVVSPLRPGIASAVIYKDGTLTVGQWDRDVRMTPDVVGVRQNLALIVDGSAPVPGLSSADNIKWGATLGGAAYVWRSGLGVTSNGALVYVGGPGMSITNLADLLVRAGAVRAMELDINTDWVNYSTYAPTPGQPASPANGTPLLSSMSGGPARYFASYWARDFFTMSARFPANGTETPPTTTTTKPKSSSKR